ncbi:hypothetical protein ACFWPH_28455 [Nocardia sp. NPDC058499]|uniref:hypothetical protein n=1 Tax=Nocardia sp. NPDC058499 TaxID=3346530 RepID=UPI003662617D
MTRDKQRKQAAHQHKDTRGVRYRRAMRELDQQTEPGHGDDSSGSGWSMVRQAADKVTHRVMALQHIPTEPVEHRADHLGQCLSQPVYATAVDLAHRSAVYVCAAAGSGVVDEVSLHHARQIVGQLTRASAANRNTLAQMVFEAHHHAVGLSEVVAAAMVASCELATQVRMARNDWYCEVSGYSQACTPGARDVRLQVRDNRSGRAVDMPPGCVGHVAEEIATWTGIADVEIEVFGPNQSVVDLTSRRASGLRETEHWLLGPQWWDKQHTLAPQSPFTALFR